MYGVIRPTDVWGIWHIIWIIWHIIPMDNGAVQPAMEDRQVQKIQHGTLEYSDARTQIILTDFSDCTRSWVLYGSLLNPNQKHIQKVTDTAGMKISVGYLIKLSHNFIKCFDWVKSIGKFLWLGYLAWQKVSQGIRNDCS